MTAYCCDKLCSDVCCALLRITLDRLAHGKLSTGHNEYGVQYVSFGDGHMCTDDKMVHPFNDVHDPAKLAELGAMALRARGVPVVCAKVGSVIHVHLPDPIVYVFALSPFRTLLARIMATPANESSREKCEKLIRGES